MSLPEALKTLGVPSSASKDEIKQAFRQRIREVHPDVTGDDGTLLQKVREAFRIVESLANPEVWDPNVLEDGLPAWASGLLQGVRWSSECPNYASFLEKPDQKALAVGEISEKTGERPWGAAWGKYSQQEASSEALRLCRQYGGKCRLIYVGSGTARQRPLGVDTTTPEEERTWWTEQFQAAGEMPGFGWMPMVNPEKEKLVGYKTVLGGDRFGAEVRVRVPVFEPIDGGIPYYYSPLKPKERIQLRRTPFKRIQKLTGKRMKHDPRYQKYKDYVSEKTQQNFWD